MQKRVRLARRGAWIALRVCSTRGVIGSVWILCAPTELARRSARRTRGGVAECKPIPPHSDIGLSHNASAFGSSLTKLSQQPHCKTF